MSPHGSTGSTSYLVTRLPRMKGNRPLLSKERPGHEKIWINRFGVKAGKRWDNPWIRWLLSLNREYGDAVKTWQDAPYTVEEHQRAVIRDSSVR